MASSPATTARPPIGAEVVRVPPDIVQDFGAENLRVLFAVMRERREHLRPRGGSFGVEFDVHRDGTVAAGHVTTRERL